MKKKSVKVAGSDSRFLSDYTVSSLAMLTMYELIDPKSPGYLLQKRQREEMLLEPESKDYLLRSPWDREKEFRDQPDHWTVKLTRKLDRLTFPEFTGRKGKVPSEAQRLARLLRSLQCNTSASLFNDLQNRSLFGIKLTERIMRAVWSFDGDFFKQFGKAIRKEMTPTGRLYIWLLNRREKVERCKTVAEIMKLEGFRRITI